jgi:hypothetical protein
MAGAFNTAGKAAVNGARLNDWAPGLETEAAFKERGAQAGVQIVESLRVPLRPPWSSRPTWSAPASRWRNRRRSWPTGQRLVRPRTSVINQIRAFLLERGIAPPLNDLPIMMIAYDMVVLLASGKPLSTITP